MTQVFDEEATEADVGKLCYFWDGDEDYSKQIGLLTMIRTENCIFKYVLANSVCFAHCRKLTKQETIAFIQNHNSAISDTGLIYNWNTSSNFDEKGECLINFELPYSNSSMIKVDPQDKCLVFDITRTSFKIKRKNKLVKEVKWFAVGY